MSKDSVEIEVALRCKHKFKLGHHRPVIEINPKPRKKVHWKLKVIQLTVFVAKNSQ